MDTREQKIPGPDHPITIEATGRRIIVRARGVVVADSTATLTLHEAGYPPVHYFPIRDVDQTWLRPSSTSTYCPYKGNASYYSIAGPDGEVVDAIWTYEDAYPAVMAIAGYLAFYPDRVEITSVDEMDHHFAADVDPTRARVMYAVQQALAASAFEDVMGVPAWKSLPSWYLVAADDQAIPPAAERQFAKRMGATAVEAPSSHVAMVSHPSEVVELIERAAAAVPVAP
jgi:uncharacterized protein (DUF427 family)